MTRPAVEPLVDLIEVSIDPEVYVWRSIEPGAARSRASRSQTAPKKTPTRNRLKSLMRNAIEAAGLSKRYRIAAARPQTGTGRAGHGPRGTLDAVMSTLRSSART